MGKTNNTQEPNEGDDSAKLPGNRVGTNSKGKVVAGKESAAFTSQLPVYQNQNPYAATAGPSNLISSQGVQLHGYNPDIQWGMANQQSMAGQQQDFINALQARAMGQGGPSVAENQLRQGLAQNAKQAASVAASQRGMSPAMAARLAANAQGDMGQQYAGQAATLRAQEQLAAQGLLGQTIGQARGQDVDVYGSAGQLLGGQNTMASQQNTAQARLNNDASIAQANLNQQAALAGQQRSDQIAGGVISAAGNVATQAFKTYNQAGGDGGSGGSTGSSSGGVSWSGDYAYGGEVDYGLPLGSYGITQTQSSQSDSANKTTLPAITSAQVNSAAKQESWAEKLPFVGGIFKASAADDKHANQKFNVSTPEGRKAYDDSNDEMEKAGAGAALQFGTDYLKYFGGGGAVSAIGSLLGGLFANGGPVPGRAPVPGDDPRNDTTLIKASPGEIVLPRTVSQAPDAPERAAKFVAALQASHKPTYADVLMRRRQLMGGGR